MGSICLALLFPHTKYDYLQILLFAGILLTLNLGAQVQEQFNKLDKLVMPMYIWQMVSIRLVALMGELTSIRFLAVFAVDLVISSMWLWTSKWFRLHKEKIISMIGCPDGNKTR